MWFCFDCCFRFLISTKTTTQISSHNQNTDFPNSDMFLDDAEKSDIVAFSTKKVTMSTFWSNVGFVGLFLLRWPLQECVFVKLRFGSWQTPSPASLVAYGSERVFAAGPRAPESHLGSSLGACCRFADGESILPGALHTVVQRQSVG